MVTSHIWLFRPRRSVYCGVVSTEQLLLTLAVSWLFNNQLCAALTRRDVALNGIRTRGSRSRSYIQASQHPYSDVTHLVVQASSFSVASLFSVNVVLAKQLFLVLAVSQLFNNQYCITFFFWESQRYKEGRSSRRSESVNNLLLSLSLQSHFFFTWNSISWGFLIIGSDVSDEQWLRLTQDKFHENS